MCKISVLILLIAIIIIGSSQKSSGDNLDYLARAKQSIIFNPIIKSVFTNPASTLREKFIHAANIDSAGWDAKESLSDGRKNRFYSQANVLEPKKIKISNENSVKSYIGHPFTEYGAPKRTNALANPFPTTIYKDIYQAPENIIEKSGGPDLDDVRVLIARLQKLSKATAKQIKQLEEHKAKSYITNIPNVLITVIKNSPDKNSGTLSFKTNTADKTFVSEPFTHSSNFNAKVSNPFMNLAYSYSPQLSTSFLVHNFPQLPNFPKHLQSPNLKNKVSKSVKEFHQQRLFEHIGANQELLPAALPLFFGMIPPKPWRSQKLFKPYPKFRQKRSNDQSNLQNTSLSDKEASIVPSYSNKTSNESQSIQFVPKKDLPDSLRAKIEKEGYILDLLEVKYDHSKLQYDPIHFSINNTAKYLEPLLPNLEKMVTWTAPLGVNDSPPINLLRRFTIDSGFWGPKLRRYGRYRTFDQVKHWKEHENIRFLMPYYDWLRILSEDSLAASGGLSLPKFEKSFVFFLHIPPVRVVFKNIIETRKTLYWPRETKWFQFGSNSTIEDNVLDLMQDIEASSKIEANQNNKDITENIAEDTLNTNSRNKSLRLIPDAQKGNLSLDNDEEQIENNIPMFSTKENEIFNTLSQPAMKNYQYSKDNKSKDVPLAITHDKKMYEGLPVIAPLPNEVFTPRDFNGKQSTTSKRTKRSLFTNPIFESVFNNADNSKSFTQKFFEGSRRGDSNLLRMRYAPRKNTIYNIKKPILSLRPPKTKFAKCFRKYSKTRGRLAKELGKYAPVPVNKVYIEPTNSRSVYYQTLISRPQKSYEVPIINSQQAFQRLNYVIPGYLEPQLPYYTITNGNKPPKSLYNGLVLPKTKPHITFKYLGASTYYGRSKRSLFSNPLFESVFQNFEESKSFQDKFFGGSRRGDIINNPWNNIINCREHNGFHVHDDQYDEALSTPFKTYRVPQVAFAHKNEATNIHKYVLPHANKIHGYFKQSSTYDLPKLSNNISNIIKPVEYHTALKPTLPGSKITINYDLPVYLSPQGRIKLPTLNKIKVFRGYETKQKYQMLLPTTKSPAYFQNHHLTPTNKNDLGHSISYFAGQNQFNAPNKKVFVYIPEYEVPKENKFIQFKNNPAAEITKINNNYFMGQNKITSQNKVSSLPILKPFQVFQIPKQNTFIDFQSKNVKTIPVEQNISYTYFVKHNASPTQNRNNPLYIKPGLQIPKNNRFVHFHDTQFYNKPTLVSSIPILTQIPTKNKTGHFKNKLVQENNLINQHNVGEITSVDYNLGQKQIETKTKAVVSINIKPVFEIPYKNKNTFFKGHLPINKHANHIYQGNASQNKYISNGSNSLNHNSIKTTAQVPNIEAPKMFQKNLASNVKNALVLDTQIKFTIPAQNLTHKHHFITPNQHKSIVFNSLANQNAKKTTQSQFRFDYSLNVPKENINKLFFNNSLPVENIPVQDTLFLKVPKHNFNKSFITRTNKINHFEEALKSTLDPTPFKSSSTSIPKALEDNIKYNLQFTAKNIVKINEERTLLPNIAKKIYFATNKKSPDGNIISVNDLNLTQSYLIANKTNKPINNLVISIIKNQNVKHIVPKLPNIFKKYMFKQNAMFLPKFNYSLARFQPQNMFNYTEKDVDKILNSGKHFANSLDWTQSYSKKIANKTENKTGKPIKNLVVSTFRNQNVRLIGLILPKFFKIYMFKENAMLLSTFDSPSANFQPQNYIDNKNVGHLTQRTQKNVNDNNYSIATFSKLSPKNIVASFFKNKSLTFGSIDSNMYRQRNENNMLLPNYQKNRVFFVPKNKNIQHVIPSTVDTLQQNIDYTSLFATNESKRDETATFSKLSQKNIVASFLKNKSLTFGNIDSNMYRQRNENNMLLPNYQKNRVFFVPKNKNIQHVIPSTVDTLQQNIDYPSLFATNEPKRDETATFSKLSPKNIVASFLKNKSLTFGNIGSNMYTQRNENNMLLPNYQKNRVFFVPKNKNIQDVIPSTVDTLQQNIDYPSLFATNEPKRDETATFSKLSPKNIVASFLKNKSLTFGNIDSNMYRQRNENNMLLPNYQKNRVFFVPKNKNIQHVIPSTVDTLQQNIHYPSLFATNEPKRDETATFSKLSPKNIVASFLKNKSLTFGNIDSNMYRQRNENNMLLPNYQKNRVFFVPKNKNIQHVIPSTVDTFQQNIDYPSLFATNEPKRDETATFSKLSPKNIVASFLKNKSLTFGNIDSNMYRQRNENNMLLPNYHKNRVFFVPKNKNIQDVIPSTVDTLQQNIDYTSLFATNEYKRDETELLTQTLDKKTHNNKEDPSKQHGNITKIVNIKQDLPLAKNNSFKNYSKNLSQQTGLEYHNKALGPGPKNLVSLFLKNRSFNSNNSNNSVKENSRSDIPIKHEIPDAQIRHPGILNNKTILNRTQFRNPNVSKSNLHKNKVVNLRQNVTNSGNSGNRYIIRNRSSILRSKNVNSNVKNGTSTTTPVGAVNVVEHTTTVPSVVNKALEKDLNVSESASQKNKVLVKILKRPIISKNRKNIVAKLLHAEKSGGLEQDTVIYQKSNTK